jgi:hypothetical protein
MDRQEYSDSLKFEHELINRRLTWLLTSETILFAGYGLAIDKAGTAEAAKILPVIAGAGISIAAFILLGVCAAATAKYCAWQDFRKASGKKQEQFGTRTWITSVGFVADFALPVIFIFAWCRLLN